MKQDFITFEEEFNHFSSKFELRYIQNAIDIWLDFQIIQKDMLLFVKSPNAHPDGPMIRSDPSKDHLLDVILGFDLHRSRYLEINTAFQRFTRSEQVDFYKIYLQGEDIGYFTKYDLLVKLAGLTEDFIFSEEIGSYYSILKKDYLTRVQDALRERKKNISHWIDRYGFLIHPDWKGNWDRGNGEASRHWTMFILATLYKDGLLSERYLFEHIKKYRGGKKYYRFLMNNL